MLNIADAALPPRTSLGETAPIVMIAGTSMNSGKTYAATELIKQATRAGLRVAAGKTFGSRVPARHVEHVGPRRGRDGEFSRLWSAVDG